MPPFPRTLNPEPRVNTSKIALHFSWKFRMPGAVYGDESNFVDMIRRNYVKMAESIAGFRHVNNENIAYIFMMYQTIAPLF